VEVKYPKGFPQDHVTLVEIERIRADREVNWRDSAAIQSVSELQHRGLRWVCRILGAFCHQACELGHRRHWTLMQIRAEVENFRLDLVRYVHFTVGSARLGWVDRVFGTTIDTEVRRGIENSEEWHGYLDELSALAEALAPSEDQMARPDVTVDRCGSQASTGASGAPVWTDPSSRETRLEQFRVEHDLTIADIARSAKVHKPDFQKWRSGELKEESVMSRRIESVLSGKRPVLRKRPDELLD
jgi:hypothetical protein